MSSQQQRDSNYQTGYQGGNVNTNGMSWQQKQQTDADVNRGKKDANR